MRTRIGLLGLILLALCGAAWTKDDPAVIIAQSDAQYYYPTQHGLQDLAADLVIQELQDSPVGKLAKISYYYVSEERQRFEVMNIPDQFGKFRDDLASLVEPLSNYIVPMPSTETFNGLDLRVDRVARLFAGRPETSYVQIVGTAKDKGALVREYRMLLDGAGLAVQAESIFKDDSKLIARIDNVKIGEKWCYASITTRMAVNGLPQWRIMAIEYTQVDGFTVPATITIRVRNARNKPVDGTQDWTITFTNYRLNKGVAAKQIPAPPEKPAEKPADTAK
jgi:hypothetical protein